MGEPNEMIGRAAAGDRDALSALLSLHAPTVQARLHIDNTWRASFDASDVMQVTFLEAFLRITQLKAQTEESFVAWLTRIAENNLRDAIDELECARRPDLRRQIRTRTPDESISALMEGLMGTSATPSRDAAKQEHGTLLHRALVKLPESYQAVVRGMDLDGRPCAEVAATLGRSEGAVWMLRGRAHDALRELLESESKFFSDCA